jgi:hypothetical protein
MDPYLDRLGHTHMHAPSLPAAVEQVEALRAVENASRRRTTFDRVCASFTQLKLLLDPQKAPDGAMTCGR